MMRQGVVAEQSCVVESTTQREHQDASGPPSLRRNFSWTFVANVVDVGCRWLVLACLAKFGTPLMVGEYAFALAIGQPIIAFANLSLRGVHVTETANEYQFSDYLGLRLTAAVAAVVCIAAVAWSYRDAVALVLGVSLAVDAIADMYFGLLQKRERLDRVAIVMIIRGLLTVAVIFSLVIMTNSLIWSVLGLTVVSAAGVAGAWLSVVMTPSDDENCHLRPRFHTRTMWSLSKLAFPLGATRMLNSLTPNVVRYVIVAYLGPASLGVFAACYSLLRAGTAVVRAMGMTAQRRMSVYYAAGEIQKLRRLLLRITSQLAVLCFAMIAVGWFLGRQILTLLYTAEYAAYENVLVLILVAGGFQFISQILGSALTAVRCFHTQTQIGLAALVVSALTAGCLVPYYGLTGAAISVVATSIAMTLVRAFVLLSLLQKRASLASY